MKFDDKIGLTFGEKQTKISIGTLIFIVGYFESIYTTCDEYNNFADIISEFNSSIKSLLN